MPPNSPHRRALPFQSLLHSTPHQPASKFHESLSKTVLFRDRRILPNIRGQRIQPEYSPEEMLDARAVAARLPINAIEEEFLTALRDNDVVIVTAPTGSGKTTQISKFCRKAGYTVTLLQPRRLAATSACSRIANELGLIVGGEVGFRHAMQRVASAFTKLCVHTDGYELHRSLNQPDLQSDVLIIDEYHERNCSMDTLVALNEVRWREYRAGTGPKPPKLVIMSATMNTDELARRYKAPVITAKGRTFPIEERKRGTSMVADAVALAKEGKNTLIFLPGKAEIRAFQEELERQGIDAEIIPLHSQLTAREQELAFKKYDRPKIVLATNIAQTSLTIADIDAVIDSGLERQPCLIDGIRALPIGPITMFDVLQRMGRCGRTGPGIYIYHGDVPLSMLAPSPVPEIQRIPLENLILTLKCAGLEISRLPYMDPPPPEHVRLGTQTLLQLNLIGPRGHLTREGKLVGKLPVDVHNGRLLVTAAKLDNDFPGVLARAIDIVSIIEAEGITIPGKSHLWGKYAGDERSSDHFAQLSIFRAALASKPRNPLSMGVDPSSFRRACEIREILRKRLEVPPGQADTPINVAPAPAADIRRSLLVSIWTGYMDSVFRLTGKGGKEATWKGIRGSGERKLARGSVVNGPRLIVGQPFDLLSLKPEKSKAMAQHARAARLKSGEGITSAAAKQSPQKLEGSHIVHLINLATEIDYEWLMKFAHPALRASIESLIRAARKKGMRVKRSHEKENRRLGWRAE